MTDEQFNKLDYRLKDIAAWAAVQRLCIVVVLIWILILLSSKTRAADLAISPPAKPPERCLITGENPDPGQTLHVDKRCKSGLRWVYQH